MWNETLFLEMGSTHLHHDSALDHAKSNAHEASFQIYLRAEGCDVSECSEQRLAELQQNNQCTLSPRIQVHALTYETAHFLELSIGFVYKYMHQVIPKYALHNETTLKQFLSFLKRIEL